MRPLYSLMHAEKKFIAALAAIGRSLCPLRLLWPWLLASIAFGLFLDSPQGRALAQGFESDDHATSHVVSATFLGFIIALLPSLFTSLAAKSAVGGTPQASEEQSTRRRFWETLQHTVWGIGLAAAPGTLFGLATRSTSALLILAISVACALAAMARILVSIHRQDGKWDRVWTAMVLHKLRLAVFVFVLALLPMLLGAAIVTREPAGVVAFGPLSVAMIGLSATASLVGAVFVAVPACFHRGWLGGVLAGAMLLRAVVFQSVQFDDPNPLLEKDKARAAAAIKATSCAQVWHGENSVWKRERLIKNGNVDSTPVYVVSAEGGGIRSAYWTATGLAALDLTSGDRFRRSVVYLSGVSGGSLGIATWLAASELPHTSPEKRMQAIEKFLAGDFLSPVLAGFFFLDVPRFAFGSLWFSSRRDHVFEKAIADRWHDQTGSDFFFRPLQRPCLRETFEGITRSAPIMSFGAVDVQTGRPVSLENSIGGETYELSIVEAVHASARFPFLSPALELPVTEERFRSEIKLLYKAVTPSVRQSAVAKVDEALARLSRDAGHLRRRAVLVDGGYFDNSGLVAARKFIGETFRPSSQDNVKIIHFTSNPDERGVCLPITEPMLRQVDAEIRTVRDLLDLKCVSSLVDLERSMAARPWQWLTTPLEALFAVREARSAAERDSRNNVSMSFASMLEGTFGNERAPLTATSEVVAVRTAVSEISGELELAQKGYVPPGLDNEEYVMRIKLLEEDQKKLLSYLPYILSVEARTVCAADKPRAPPLGWTLNKEDRSMLSCFAVRAAHLSNLDAPEFPETSGERRMPLSESQRISVEIVRK